MPDPIPSIEDDPCARATALKAAKDKLITGEGVAEYEADQGNGVRRRVKYSAANMSALESEIREAENACRISQGGKPKRYALGSKGVW